MDCSPFSLFFFLFSSVPHSLDTSVFFLFMLLPLACLLMQPPRTTELPVVPATEPGGPSVTNSPPGKHKSDPRTPSQRPHHSSCFLEAQGESYQGGVDHSRLGDRDLERHLDLRPKPEGLETAVMKPAQTRTRLEPRHALPGCTSTLSLGTRGVGPRLEVGIEGAGSPALFFLLFACFVLI